MKLVVLGSSAGGGLPQWNCGCANCHAARRGDGAVTPRTQSSIAVSGGEGAWIVINASPDISTQLARTPALQPPSGYRRNPMQAVMLVDAQIDHAAGLLSLREGTPLALYTTASVYAELCSSFPIVSLLGHYCGVEWHEIPTTGDGFAVTGVTGLGFTAVPLYSKPPPYSGHRETPRAGDNIGLIIHDRRSGGRVFYAPGLGILEPALQQHMAAADCVLVDGSFWTDSEMSERGTGVKRAADMGHLPLDGESGMLAFLQGLPEVRKYLIHVNNTNPVVNPDSAEHAALRDAGVTLTHDGMQIEV